MSDFENVKAEAEADIVGFCDAIGKDIGSADVYIPDTDDSWEFAAEIARRWNLHERLVKALERAFVNEHNPFEIERMEALLRETKGAK